MSKPITAHTNAGTFPGYINCRREDDGSVTITLRGDPSTVEGEYVCSYPRQKGQPGRCTPGDEACNNYCNMAPAKGPMQDHPAACTLIREGASAVLTLSAADFAALIADCAKA